MKIDGIEHHLALTGLKVLVLVLNDTGQENCP